MFVRHTQSTASQAGSSGHLAIAAACALALLSSCGGRTTFEERQSTEVPAPKQPDMGPSPDVTKKTPPKVSDPVPTPVPTPIGPNRPLVSPPLCAGDAPFGEPSQLPGIDPSLSIEGAWLSDDRLELIVGARAGDAAATEFDLRVARRESIEVAFGALAAVNELNSIAIERKPVLTMDGLSLFFESDRLGETSDIFLAERALVGGKFGDARLVTEVSTPRNDAPGSMSVANTLYFTAVRMGGEGTENLFQAARNGDGTFSERYLISSVDSDGSNVAPAISSDELTLYFSSNRDNREDQNHDVFRARRPASDKLFGLPLAVAELNSNSSDIVTWVSLDECRLLLTRETAPGTGRFNLLLAER